MKKALAVIANHKMELFYLFWGGLTTVVSWGSYALFAGALNFSIGISNAFSWIFATTFAFLSNKYFVFESKSWSLSTVKKELGLFVSTRIGTGIFEIAIVPAFVFIGFDQMIFGVKGAWAKITASVIVVVLNYFFSKHLVFNKQH